MNEDALGAAGLAGLRRDAPACRIIIITAFGTIKNAVEATKLGAYAYLEKPVDNDELLLLIGRSLPVMVGPAELPAAVWMLTLPVWAI